MSKRDVVGIQQQTGIIESYLADSHALRTFLDRASSLNPDVLAEARQLLALEDKWRGNEMYGNLQSSFDTVRQFLARQKPESVVVGIPPLPVSPRLEERVEIPALLPAPVSIQPLTTPDILSYFASQGITGEERTACGLVYALLGGLNFGIVSLSGSGKSVLHHAVLGLFPPEKPVRIFQKVSPAALPNDAALCDGKYVHYAFLELQNSKDAVEILKTLAEGQPFRYTKTDRTGYAVETLTVPPRQISYTLAITNAFAKTLDEELERRFIKFYTDVSGEQTARVITNYARAQARSGSLGTVDTSFKQQIACRLGSLSSFVNPFLVPFVESLPSELRGNIRVRSFIKYWNGLMQGSAVYHSSSRVQEGETRYANLEDFFNVHQAYGPLFYNNILGLSVVDSHVLNLFAVGESRSFSDVVGSVENLPARDKKTLVQGSLETLEGLGFVEKRGMRYTQLKEPTIPAALAWAELYEGASMIMREHHPSVFPAWDALNRSQPVYDLVQQKSVALIGETHGA